MGFGFVIIFHNSFEIFLSKVAKLSLRYSKMICQNHLPNKSVQLEALTEILLH